jgi:hypothetical protein
MKLGAGLKNTVELSKNNKENLDVLVTGTETDLH